MSWKVEWNALSAHIHGVSDAATFFFRTVAERANDPYQTLKIGLLPQIRELHTRLELFSSAHGASVPTDARNCINQFLKKRSDVFRNIEVDAVSAVQFCVTTLTAFRSEFEYHIADLAAFARRRSDRAFIHLQRTLIVNGDERSRWQQALSQNEPACEELGSTHLLAHGIWAFKVNGTGERTDLVFQEPMEDLVEIERSADVLLLTEWKICKSQQEVDRKLTEAMIQAKLYSVGVLAGIELTSYRYLILVSTNQLRLPDDAMDNGILYRHINIAVDPTSPSKIAKAQSSSKLLRK